MTPPPEPRWAGRRRCRRSRASPAPGAPLPRRADCDAEANPGGTVHVCNLGGPAMAVLTEDTELAADALAYVIELYRELNGENGAPSLGTQNQAVEFILADPEL